jgi:hypothetical protein
MRDQLARAYAAFREPRNFLRIVVAYVVASLVLHWLRGYDPDWGDTNLTFSIEATISSAIIMMQGRESQRMADDARRMHGETLQAVLDIAKAQRDTLRDQATHLRHLADHYAHLAGRTPLPNPPDLDEALPASGPSIHQES